MIEVCLLGTGGMYPLPGRALTSLYLRHCGSAVLVDCGEGTQVAVRSAGLRFKAIDGILFTHFHADHISGLPGMLLTIGNEGRREPLRLYGPAGLEATVGALRAIVPELPYEIIFSELAERGVKSISLAGMEIKAFPVDHGIPCLGYCFEVRRPGRFDAVKALERGVPQRLWSRLQRGEAAEGYLPADVLGPERRGLKLLYSTDSRPVAEIAEMGKEADLMILEGMLGAPEEALRAERKLHMTMQEAAQLAARAGAGELWLTHFSPANMTPGDYMDAVQTIFPNAVAAKDGMKKTLRFSEPG